MDIPLPPVRRLLRPFVFHLGLIAILVACCIGIGLLASTLYDNEQLLMTRARSTASTLVQVRAWLSMHGGAWLDYATKPADDAPAAGKTLTAPKTIRTEDGKKLYLVNPATLLAEISGLPGDASPSYRLFSQTPVNPANLPDAFERQAMTLFQNGSSEASSRVLTDGQLWFRYARPLTVDASCLACHADQGYILGERRGGIGVSFPVGPGEKLAAIQWFSLICLCLASLGLAVLIPWMMRRHFIRTVTQMEARLAEMAATDELTGLANRRYFFRRYEEEFSRAIRHERSLGILMIDIDHFKLVNDYYGHQVGDQALQLLASILKSNCRLSDLVARYGGEEFVVLLPEIDLKGAQVLAEKLRGAVASANVKLSAQQQADRPGTAALGPTTTRFEPDVLRFTISLGLAILETPALKDLVPPTRLVALADAALYQAKHTGRNRVTVHQ